MQKITPEATHTYFYDGWLLVKEIVANVDESRSVIEYHWGKDLSGTIGGAGGVGGLLYLAISNSNSQLQLYVPWYDAYGNVMGYWDAQGNVVAEYTYDAFGKLISSSGPMADVFAFRYSTKYFDSETGLYYYGYRFYSPELMRWITRDPIGEEGGVNLYAFCYNNSIISFDALGATSVRLSIGTELRDSPRGLLNFIKIDATVIEPPSNGGKLNFIQLRKSRFNDWELDIQGTPGPYYYKLLDVKKYSRRGKEGDEIVTLYDAPGGFLDKVDFFTAVVEVNRSCYARRHRYGFPVFDCYDKVQVLSSVSWSFDPNMSGYYQYSGKADNFIRRGSMIPTMQQLINLSTWNTELCPTTRVEVQNDHYRH